MEVRRVSMSLLYRYPQAVATWASLSLDQRLLGSSDGGHRISSVRSTVSTRSHLGHVDRAERDQGCALPNTSKNTSPYRSSLSGPTPERAKSSSAVDGRASAMARSVLSLKTT